MRGDFGSRFQIAKKRGDNQARPTVIDSRSILAGVQGFESLSPHLKQSIALID
jgi:hypothetical protein